MLPLNNNSLVDGFLNEKENKKRPQDERVYALLACNEELSFGFLGDLPEKAPPVKKAKVQTIKGQFTNGLTELGGGLFQSLASSLRSDSTTPSTGTSSTDLTATPEEAVYEYSPKPFHPHLFSNKLGSSLAKRATCSFDQGFPIFEERSFSINGRHVNVLLQAYDDKEASHGFEDGACAFFVNDAAHFILCDGVSAANPLETAPFVKALMQKVKEKLLEKQDFVFQEASVRALVNECLAEIKDQFNADNPPSTTFSLVKVGQEGIDYFIVGDSGLYLQEKEKEPISMVDGASVPQFSLEEFLKNPDIADIFIDNLYIPCPLQIAPQDDLEDKESFPKILCGKMDLPKEEATLIIGSDGIWDNMNPKDIVAQGSIENVSRKSRQLENFRQFWQETLDGWEGQLESGLKKRSFQEKKDDFLYNLPFLKLPSDVKQDDSTAFVIQFTKETKTDTPLLDKEGILAARPEL